MRHDFELSANAMVSESERIPKVVARAIECIQRLFHLSDQEQVGIHSEKLCRESADIAHQLHPAPRDRAIDERHRTMQIVRRPGKSVSASLERAISGLGRRLTFGRAAQFRVLVTGKPRTLTPSLQGQIYLMVREAAINAFHHSAATFIEVRIEYLRRRVWVLVRDNGCGFDAAMVRSVGDSRRGLQGMCDRAGSAGAKLRIWSKAGAGTEIEISAPTNIAAVQFV